MKSSNPESTLMRAHRFNAWSDQYRLLKAQVENAKAVLDKSSSELELSVLEGREELRLMRECEDSSVIEKVCDDEFVRKCDGFKPRMALLRRFGVESETDYGIERKAQSDDK